MLVENGRIMEIITDRQVPAPASAFDFGDAIIAPGFVELHIHGSAGSDVMDDSDTALPSIEHFLARHGVTSYFPTTVTAPIEKTLRALDRLAGAIETRSKHQQASDAPSTRACPIGIHLEGPFISHIRRGVHPTEHLLPPTIETFNRFWDAARGQIRLMTIAPELDGAVEVIQEATRRGVCMSIGHSDADLAATERAIAAGVRHATHTFNAMRPLDHRSPGILGSVLTDPRLSADIIADAVHVDSTVVRLFAHSKGPRQTVLITDATSATGMPDGRYRLGSLDVEVSGSKVTSNGRLAGSVLTMDCAVRNLALFAGWTLSQAVAAASVNPACVASLSSKGTLAPGADADFVVMSPSGNVLRTFIGGQECIR